MFRFKQFTILQEKAAFKVGTDSIILGASANHPQNGRILDIGTGTGLLALMMAQKYPEASIDAVENDSNSAKQAKKNFDSSPFAHQITLFDEDINNFVQGKKPVYDLIVCNPPFFNQEEGTLSPHKNKQKARHSVSLSFEQLINVVSKVLAENGRFFTIMPISQHELIKKSIQKASLFITGTTFINPKPSKPPHRLLFQIERQPAQHQINHLTIETEKRHRYTRAYFDLTKSYYLDLKHE